MGRHSAPDDAADDRFDEPATVAAATAVADRPADLAPRGRHARPDVEDVVETATAPPIADPAAQPSAAESETRAAAAHPSAVESETPAAVRPRPFSLRRGRDPRRADPKTRPVTDPRAPEASDEARPPEAAVDPSRAATAATEVPAARTRADSSDDSAGLGLLDDVFARDGDDHDGGRALPDAAVSSAAPVQVAEPDEATARIPVIADPVVDQAIPEALTEVIPPIEPEAPADAPADAPTAAPADALTGASADAPADAITAVAPSADPVVTPTDAAAPDTRADTAAAVPETVPPVAAPPATGRPDAAAPASAPHPGGRATAADLALLRQHGDVRARAIAGVVLPFAIYVGVLFALDAFTTRTFLVWLAVPIVVAGILFGLFLDLGHRRYPGAAVAVAPEGPAPAEPVSESSSRP